jgi:hypothetical protein
MNLHLDVFMALEFSEYNVSSSSPPPPPHPSHSHHPPVKPLSPFQTAIGLRVLNHVILVFNILHVHAHNVFILSNASP